MKAPRLGARSTRTLGVITQPITAAKWLLKTSETCAYTSARYIATQPLSKSPILAQDSYSAKDISRRDHDTFTSHNRLQSSSSLSLTSVVLFIAAAAAYYTFFTKQGQVLQPEQEQEQDMASTFTTGALPGRPGTLTAEEEEKVKQLWAALFRVTGVTASTETEPQPSQAPTAPGGLVDTTNQATVTDRTEKKKRRSFFSRKSKETNELETPVASPTKSGGVLTPSTPASDADDKYGQNKEFLDALANSSPEAIRATVWSMVKHDHPDALLLRFLRARKWDVEKALVMLVSTMHWRAEDMHVDDDIMKNGELAALEAEKGPDGAAKSLGHDFLSQIRMGKSFVHGTDKAGRPICVVRVRLHHAGDQSVESVERSTVFVIETVRMMLRSPIDTATIVFDMSHFSMANMDYTPVKFMIKCFEANYPECLGSVLVHRSPWIFQGIWKIIRGWLDPVVASKVHFTNNLKDIEEYIEPKHVLKELDGEEEWAFNYVEPTPGENDKMKDTATRDKLVAGRESLCKAYEATTLEWIKAANAEESNAIKARREDIATKLGSEYWVLDPYIRARSLYDRTGVIQGSKVDFYPNASSNGAAHTETSAADVD